MTEIKISDLSIGDWVRVDDFDKVLIKRVSAIDGTRNQIGIIKNNRSGIYWYYDDEFEPIPLTPEILAKNGFDAPKAKVWNDSWYWSNRKDVALELRESFGLWYMEIVTKEQRSGLQSNRKLGIGLKYVHQLQNALRLAGVGKEIEV